MQQNSISKPMATNNRMNQVIYFLMQLVYGTSIMLLSIIMFANFPDSTITLQYDLLIENWKQDAIDDIVLKDAQTPCDFQYVNLLQYNYYGTKPGCSCNTNVMAVGCTPEQLKQGCQTIKELPQQVLNMWGNQTTNTSFKICARKMKGINFYSQGNSSLNCVGFNQCGGISNATKMCLPLNQHCPINKISFSKQTFTSQNITPSEYSLGDGTTVYFSTKYDSMPLSQLRITEGSGVCQNNNENNVVQNRNFHILSNENSIQPCQTDINFKQISLISEDKFFIYNGISLPILYIQNLTLTQPKLIDPNYNFGLYGKGYIQWNIDCRDLELREILENQDTLNNIQKIQLATMIFNIIYFMCISIIIGSCFCLPIKKRRSRKSKYQDQANEEINWGLICIKIIFCIMQGTCICTLFAYTFNYYVLISNVQKKQCSDEQTQDMFQRIYDELGRGVYPINITLFVEYIVELLIDACILVFLCSKKSNKESGHTQLDTSSKYINQTKNIELANASNYYTGDYNANNVQIPTVAFNTLPQTIPMQEQPVQYEQSIRPYNHYSGIQNIQNKDSQFANPNVNNILNNQIILQSEIKYQEDPLQFQQQQQQQQIQQQYQSQGMQIAQNYQSQNLRKSQIQQTNPQVQIDNQYFSEQADNQEQYRKQSQNLSQFQQQKQIILQQPQEPQFKANQFNNPYSDIQLKNNLGSSMQIPSRNSILQANTIQLQNQFTANQDNMKSNFYQQEPIDLHKSIPDYQVPQLQPQQFEQLQYYDPQGKIDPNSLKQEFNSSNKFVQKEKIEFSQNNLIKQQGANNIQDNFENRFNQPQRKDTNQELVRKQSDSSFDIDQMEVPKFQMQNL